jgi:hypothetical protein
VDLTKDNLWTSIRRRYKSMINKVLKDDNFQIFIMDKNNLDYSIHEIYRELHHKCAGKVTRPKSSFDKQFEILKNGNATLIGLKYQNKFIGMNYFYHFNDKVLYASGADDPEYTNKGFNIYHPILWSAQKHFKEQGYKYLDYSQPCGYSKIQGLDDYYDDKQLNISYFKRGMGAELTPLFRGIKYFNKENLNKDIELLKQRISDDF